MKYSKIIIYVTLLFLTNEGYGQCFFGGNDIPVWFQATYAQGTLRRLNGGTNVYRATATTAAPLTDQNNRCDNGHWNWPACNGTNFQQWDLVGACTIVTCSAPGSGSIGNSHTICSGGDPSTITNVAGGGASTYEWQWSPNGTGSWTTIGGATSSTYNPPSGLTVDRWYRRRGGDCSPTEWSPWTNIIKVTVLATPSAGSIGNSHTICSGGDPSTITNVAGGSASTYEWQWSPNGTGSWTTIGGATSSTYNPPSGLTVDRWYRRRGRASCSPNTWSSWTNTIQVSIASSLNEGAIGSAQTICYNTSPAQLTDDTSPTGGSGSYAYQWQISTDGISWSNVAGATSATYSPGALTANRYYRRAVTSCSDTKFTTSLLITVNPELVSGTIGSLQTICYNGTPSGLTSSSAASGGDGSYSYQWQISTDGISWSNIAGATSTSYSPGALTVNTYYRRAVTSCSDTKYTTSLLITVNSLPIIDLGNDTSICIDRNIVFEAGTGYVDYLWNTGSVTDTINVNTSGDYSVRVTDGNGCIGRDTISLSLDSLPVIDLGADTSICFDASLILRAGSGYVDYLWDRENETSDTILVNVAGTYGVRVTDGNGCIGRDTINLSIDSLPVIDLGNDTSICIDQMIVFEAGTGYVDYLWNTGSVTDTININTSGDYAVRVTDGNGCIGRDTISLSIDSLPVIDLGSDTSICIDKNIVFEAGTGYVDYLWNTGSVTDTINVNTSGDYSVRVTDGNGCIGRDTISLSLDSLPIIDLGVDTSICFDASLILRAGTGYVDYLWDRENETSDTILVNVAGTYGVRVTDGNGCIGRDTINVSIDSLPVIDLGVDTSICIDRNIVFEAGTGYVDYLWNTGSVTDTINVNTSGDYSVRVTDGNGCIGRDTINLSIDSLPIIDLGVDTSICFDASLILRAGTGYVDYLWDRENETSDTILVNVAGTYGVRVTDGNGCIGRDTINVSIDSLPVIDLGVDTSICIDRNIVFEAGTGYVDYLWNTGSVTDTIVVNTSGDYSVRVTDGNGCIGRDTISLSIDSLPVIDLGNDTSICIDQMIVFEAGTGYVDYLWNTGSVTDTINVNTSGDYSVRVTDGNGCIGRDTISLSLDSLPIIDLGVDTSICFDASLILRAGTGYVDYLWDRENETSDTILVNVAGTYGVRVTDGNGCIGRDTINVSIDSLPVIDLGVDTSICIDRNIVFEAGTGYVYYLWNTGSLTDTIVVNTSGDYSVRVTDGNGCIGRDTINLSIDSLPIIDLGSDTSICIDQNIVFEAGTGYVDYLWNTGSVTDTINVNTSGDYSVRVTDGNGCIGRDTISLSLDSLPVIDLGSDTSICIDKNIVFEAGTGYVDYLWNTGSVTDSIVVNTSGDYSVRVTDGNGCIGRDTIILSINPLPTPNLLNDTNLCRGDSVQIGVQNFYVDYLWRSGETKDSITVSTNGTYLITVTDTNGCVASDSVVIGLYELPIVNLGNDTSICIESDYLLNAGSEGVKYLWSTSDDSQTILTNGANTYSVTVTSIDGCVNNDTIIIDNHPSPNLNLNLSDTSICLLDSVILDGGVWDQYQWNSNNITDQTITVYQSGLYILTVKNEFGCASSDSVNIGIYSLPNSNLGNDREVCFYKNINITVPENDAEYIWNNGDTTQTISTNLPGDYSVIVTNVNGCSTRDTITITPGADLIIDLGEDATICPGVEYELSLFGFDSLSWSTIENSSSIIVDSTNKVSVLAVDENGCWGRDTIQITSVPNPTIKLREDTVICELEQESIDLIISTPNVNAFWNTGSTDTMINVNETGVYIAEVTNEFGCSSKDTVVISSYCRPIDITMPNVFSPNNDGHNDNFIPMQMSFEDKNYMLLNLNYIKFQVFNRWGQVVHASEEFLPNWNGINNLGNVSASGTYFWTLEYELINGETYSKNGFVELLGE